MKTAIIMGTRPEIIKLEPIISKLSKNSSLIFTGQHYDYNMGLKFIEQLGIKTPDYSLKIIRNNPSLQMSQIISKLSKIFLELKPENVIVQGDTNTVLAASLCSLKSKIPISHVESGLRSFDWRMPEEHNRVTTDHISDLLFAPTKTAKNNLISEKVHGKSFVTGNTVIDAINKFSNISSKKSSISIPESDFILLTLHRAENVDDEKTLSQIIKAIIDSQEKIIFPIHPRTLKKLHEFSLYKKISNCKRIISLNAIGYFDMIELMKKCSFILTDSGGLQEEATSPSIRKKVLVLRKSSDRPESIESELSELVGTNYKKIVKAIKQTSENPRLTNQQTPYGNGNSSQKIIKLMSKYI